MTQDELLHFVVGVLDGLALRYFVTGSVAAIYYGEPRFTNDIDIVVDLPAERIPELCAAFPAKDFYISEEAVRRAVGRRGTFNVLHPAFGLKIDFMVPADTVFNRQRFDRVRPRVRPADDLQEAHVAHGVEEMSNAEVAPHRIRHVFRQHRQRNRGRVGRDQLLRGALSVDP